jgi:hypothetical protein
MGSARIGAYLVITPIRHNDEGIPRYIPKYRRHAPGTCGRPGNMCSLARLIDSWGFLQLDISDRRACLSRVRLRSLCAYCSQNAYLGRLRNATLPGPMEALFGLLFHSSTVVPERYCSVVLSLMLCPLNNLPSFLDHGFHSFIYRTAHAVFLTLPSHEPLAIGSSGKSR